MAAKSVSWATTRTEAETAECSDPSPAEKSSGRSGSGYVKPRQDSVPLLEPDVGEAEALTEILHVLDHVVQATDEDLLAPVVRDIVLDDLLNVAHAAFPIRRLGTRDGRVEVKIRMLPLPLLDEAAVDQVVHVSHAEDDVQLMASVEALRPDVAKDRDELARFEVKHGLILEREPDEIRLRVLRSDIENFLDDHGVLAGSELHRRLLNGGLWHRHRLRRNRPANHGKLGTQRTDLNISS